MIQIVKDWWKKRKQKFRESKEQRKDENKRLKNYRDRYIAGISDKRTRTLSLWTLIIAIITLLFVIITFLFQQFKLFN